jgi:hypothetical protein
VTGTYDGGDPSGSAITLSDIHARALGRLPREREPLAAAVAGTIAVAESAYADFKQIVV